MGLVGFWSIGAGIVLVLGIVAWAALLSRIRNGYSVNRACGLYFALVIGAALLVSCGLARAMPPTEPGAQLFFTLFVLGGGAVLLGAVGSILLSLFGRPGR